MKIIIILPIILLLLGVSFVIAQVNLSNPEPVNFVYPATRTFNGIFGLTGSYSYDSLCGLSTCSSDINFNTKQLGICFDNESDIQPITISGKSVTLKKKLMSKLINVSDGAELSISLNGLPIENQCILPDTENTLTLTAQKNSIYQRKWGFISSLLGINIDPVWYGDALNYSHNPTNYQLVHTASGPNIFNLTKGINKSGTDGNWTIVNGNLQYNRTASDTAGENTTIAFAPTTGLAPNSGNYTLYIESIYSNDTTKSSEIQLVKNVSSKGVVGNISCRIYHWDAQVSAHTFATVLTTNPGNLSNRNLTFQIRYDTNNQSCSYYVTNNSNGIVLGSLENVRALDSSYVWDGNVSLYGGDPKSHHRFDNIYLIAGANRTQQPLAPALTFPPTSYTFNSSKVNINWTANPSGLTSFLFINGSYNRTSTSNYTFNMSNGQYLGEIGVGDGYENSTQNSTTMAFTVNNSAPTIFNISYPTNDSRFQNGTNIYINWTCVDTSGEACRVYLFINGTFNSSSSSNFTFNFVDGSYLAKITAGDESINSTSNSTQILFRVDSIPINITSFVIQDVDVDSAIPTWSTTEMANYSLVYGTTTGVPEFSVNNTSVVTTSFSVVLQSLLASTTYYANVTVCDYVGWCNTSNQLSFRTSASTGGGDSTRSSEVGPEITQNTTTTQSCEAGKKLYNFGTKSVCADECNGLVVLNADGSVVCSSCSEGFKYESGQCIPDVNVATRGYQGSVVEKIVNSMGSLILKDKPALGFIIEVTVGLGFIYLFMQQRAKTYGG